MQRGWKYTDSWSRSSANRVLTTSKATSDNNGKSTRKTIIKAKMRIRTGKEMTRKNPI
jgi:hypothetical protein